MSNPIPPSNILVQTWGEALPPTTPAPSVAAKPLLSLSLSLSILEEMVSKGGEGKKLTSQERRTLKEKVEGSWRLRMGVFLEHHYVHAAILVLIFIDVACVLCEMMLKDVCPPPVFGSSDARTLHKWEEGLSWSSRSILFLLFLHQCGLVVAYGLSYFKKVAYVVDLVIVVVAIGLEMALLALELREGGDTGGPSLTLPQGAPQKTTTTLR